MTKYIARYRHPSSGPQSQRFMMSGAVTFSAADLAEAKRVAGQKVREHHSEAELINVTPLDESSP